MILLCLAAGHMPQIGDDVLDLVVAQRLLVEPLHLHRRPMPESGWAADVALKRLALKIFSRILGPVEIRPDVGATGAIELMTDETLGHEKSLSGANGVVCRQRRVDAQLRPALCRRIRA